MHVGNFRVLVLRADLVADRVHQVRLAEPDAPVDEQRVVGATGILGHLDGRGPGQLVALALDKIAEGEIGIQPATELGQRVRGAPRQRDDRRRARQARERGFAGDARLGGQCNAVRHRGRRGRDGAAGTDFHHDLRDRGGDQLVDEFTDAGSAVLGDPVDDVTVGRQQAQATPVLDCLQRPDPGVERLFGELRFQAAEALMPERNLHDRRTCDRDGELLTNGRGGECIPGPSLWISRVSVDSQGLGAYAPAPFDDQCMLLFLVLFRALRSRT